MAIYDVGADRATAINAFLSEYSISATGDIRRTGSTHTFHVAWLNLALQHKVWDFNVENDDFVSLSKPNPSTSEALGTIITLQDHTTDYSVRYNIDALAARGLFGGSVEQRDASGNLERFAGVNIGGKVANQATIIQIIQNNGLVTEFWGAVSAGLNQTDGNTLLRCLVKTHEGAGGEIDGSRITVKASHWGDTFAVWETTLGLGEKTATIITNADSQNDTLEATVNGWGSIATGLEGINLIDVDGNGGKEFLGALSYTGIGNADKKSLYERVKSMFAYGTTNTPWGFDGDLWTGRVYDCDNLTAGSGTWVQNEQVTWGSGATAGTGTLMGVRNTAGGSNTRMVIHLETGVAPDATVTLTGATGSQAMSQASAALDTNANWIGQFYGSAWIAAFGVGISAAQLEFGDSVTSLDNEQPTVPQNVTITANAEVGNAADTPHVFLAEKDPVLNAPDYNKYSATGGETTGGTSIDVGTIDADEPDSGYVGVQHNGDTFRTYYQYASRDGSQFNLGGTLNGGTLNSAISASDPVHIAVMYEEMTGGGTTKTASNTFVFQSGTRDFIGWIRHGNLSNTPDKPVPISFSGVGSNSVALTVALEDQT